MNFTVASFGTRLVLLALALSGSMSFTMAQKRCATVEYMNTLQNGHPLPENSGQFEQWLSQKIALRQKSKASNKIQATYQIPVVVHVIHNGSPIGTGTNISDQQIMSQIAVLNKDFNRANEDAGTTPFEFQSVAGSINIEFVLAKRTPEGFGTNGIVRKQGPKTSWTLGDNAQLKALSYWPADDYLNIWVCNLASYLGYAQFPVSNLPGLEDYKTGIAQTDGVVFNYRYFGSSYENYGVFSGLDPQYDRGRTATHEIGHFFGLRHIWGDDNPNCGTDFVNDTPTQDSETYNCPSHPSAACNNTKMFQNYMDYTDDICMNLFTKGQVSRIVNVLENSPRRESLLTSPGLLDPNAIGNDLAILQVVSPSPVLCTNKVSPQLRITLTASVEPVTSFTIISVINGTTQEHAFTNINLVTGEEITITLPAVTLLTTTKNSLSFEVREPNGGIDINPQNNTAGTTSTVSAAQNIVPFRENFEGTSPMSLWTIASPDAKGVDWSIKKIGTNNTLFYNGFANAINGDQSWFVTPVLNLTRLTAASLWFDLSYAYNEGKNDNLSILASLDCGATFNLMKYQASGEDLSQARKSSTAWEPASDQWYTEKISLSEFAGMDNVRLAFVFTNKNGNNLYLDNIEFFPNENPASAAGKISTYPNPVTTGEVEVRINLDKLENAVIDVTDMMGKVLQTQAVPDALNQTITVSLKDVSAGVYVVRIITASQSWSSKLIVK